MKFYTVIKIINEYAKSTTIHGINYIFQSGIPIIERLLWIVVMMIMVFFASLLSRSAYIEWEDHPVVTTVKSTGKSIKDVEFPSITICAQGMSKEILDAAVLKQFKDYLETKGKIFEALSMDELDHEQESYIDQKFPGSKGLPNKMVEMMSSPSPSQLIQTQSLVNPEEENALCTYPMTIQKLSCKHCPDNSHVNNFLRSTSKNQKNWIINLSNGPWNKPWSNEMNNRASLECGKDMSLIFQGWIGYSDNGDTPSNVITKLKGYGYATLEFGNCINTGTVQVLLNGIKIGSTVTNKKEQKKIQFEFWDGDTLGLQEDSGMVLFRSFTYSCTECFKKGSYDSKVFYIVENVIDAVSCQKQCQKHSDCHIWTYNSYDKNCLFHSERTSKTLNSCDTCTHGPMNCTNLSNESNEIPKFMTVSLKNEVKSMYATLEGLYELSPNQHNGRPQWKIKEGNHEIISGSTLSTGGYNWYIMQDGSTRRIHSFELQIAGMPSDTKYKKFQYHNGTPDWINAASGDVIIQDFSNEFPKLMTLTLKNDVKTKLNYATLEGIYELSPNLFNGRPKWNKIGGDHVIRSGSTLGSGGYNWFIMQDGKSFRTRIHSNEGHFGGMPYDTNYKKFRYNNGTSTCKCLILDASSEDVIIQGKSQTEINNRKRRETEFKGKDDLIGNERMTNNDENVTSKFEYKDKINLWDNLLPKNIQKMNLLLNPDKKGEREATVRKAKQKYEDQFGGMDLQASYRSLFAILWYSQLPCFDVKNITSNVPGKTSIIKKCFWKEREIDCPTIFKTMPTDRGMCCVFNMKKAEELYKKSEYEELLQSMQDIDFENSFRKNKGNNDDNSNETSEYTNNNKIIGSNNNVKKLDDNLMMKSLKSEPGMKKGLRLVLDAHSNLISPGTVYDNFKGFTAIVGDASNFPLTEMNGFLLKTGQENYVSINPIDVVSDYGIKKISPSKRNCLFSDENPLNLFKNYSQANCLLECQLEHVKKEMNCTPWYFPFTGNASICNPWDKSKFLDKMKTISDDLCEYCLPDCNITIYETAVSSAPFQPCDHTNLESASMCKMFGSEFNPPPWFNDIKNQYQECFDDGKEYKMNFVVDPLSEKGQIKTGSTQECQKKCDGVLHCQFWTWNKETQICEYKNVTKGMSPTSRKNLQVVSGPKFCKVPMFVDEGNYFSNRRSFKESNIANAIFQQKVKQSPTYEAYEKDIAIVNFFFGKSTFWQFERAENMTWSDYIAQLGGILGLFLGFSVVSAIEIVYWLTIYSVRKLVLPITKMNRRN